MPSRRVTCKNESYITTVLNCPHCFQSQSTRMQALRIKVWYQDGGSTDRQARSDDAVGPHATNEGRTKVGTTQPRHPLRQREREEERESERRERRMPENHELKYLALYPRQSPVDPCAVRLRFSIITTCYNVFITSRVLSPLLLK